MAVSLIIPLHHPVISAAYRHFYAKAVKNLGVEVATAISHKADDIFSCLLEESGGIRAEAARIAMGELSQLNPTVMVQKVVDMATKTLESRSILVSFNDYQTYLTKGWYCQNHYFSIICIQRLTSIFRWGVV